MFPSVTFIESYANEIVLHNLRLREDLNTDELLTDHGVRIIMNEDGSVNRISAYTFDSDSRQQIAKLLIAASTTPRAHAVIHVRYEGAHGMSHPLNYGVADIHTVDHRAMATA